MSKADTLGMGRFGGPPKVSARRRAINDATDAPTSGVPDSRLQTLPLEQLVPTRFNPRRNFGTEEDLRDFGTKLKTKQLAPAVAVSREAYLALWEGESEAVGSHRYVIANGERRFRASQAVGLDTLEVIVDDTIAASRATFLDAVLSENNDREDLDPVEQAIGIQTMVDQLGGKAKVAEHYGKSAGWVTQQLYLLKLAPELQDLVSAGTLPVRETRALVKLPVEEQALEWERRLKARDEPKPPTSTPAPAGGQQDATFTAVKNDGPGAPAPDGRTEQVAAPAGAEGTGSTPEPAQQAPARAEAGSTPTRTSNAAAGTAESTAPGVRRTESQSSEQASGPVPEQRGEPAAPAAGTSGETPLFPYDNGPLAAGCLSRKMEVREYRRMNPVLVKAFMPRLIEDDPQAAAAFFDELQEQIDQGRAALAEG